MDRSHPCPGCSPSGPRVFSKAGPVRFVVPGGSFSNVGLCILFLHLSNIYNWLIYIEMSLLKSQGQERKVVQNSMKFRDRCLFGFRVTDSALDKQRKGGG